jgi:DNA-directed RNA polymerase subunit RPC12/RpoP
MSKAPSQRFKGPPMSLANMRENGVHAVIATCQACGHKADVNVDALPASTGVPHVGQGLRCSQCGGKRIETRPAWHTVRRPGMGS